MEFLWGEFLTLAEELTGAGTATATTEAKCRSAVSRAYYAAFHHTRSFLQARTPIPTSKATHQSVLMFFRLSSNKDWQYVAMQLERLLVSRNKADYNSPVISKPKKVADTAITMAHDIIDTVNRL